MRIANIIMAYKNPRQVERMILAMDHPDFDFYIHLDKKIDMAPFLFLKDLPRVSFIQKRTVCNWGGFQFVRAVLESLTAVLNNKIHYDFYNLLSAQDYPIKPMPEIAKFFEDNIGKSFMSYDMENGEAWWAHAKSRYETYHFTDFTFKGRYLLQRLVNSVLPKRQFPLKVKLYGTCVSSWWSISTASAIYLSNFVKSNAKLMRFMKYTWAADEFLMATLIMNSTHKDSVVNDNLRLITWQDDLPNPIIFKAEDYDKILKSDKLFARKFDVEVDETILDLIDQNVL